MSSALATLCQWAPGARAGDWTINAGVGLSEQFTDNVDLVADGGDRRADFITDVGPFISVRGAGARMSLDLDYSFRQLYFAERGDGQRVHNLASRGQLEFWRQIGFLDATASMSRQIIDNTGAISPTAAGQAVNRTDLRSVTLSPFFLHHLGPWADTELRLRYGLVSVDTATIPDASEYSADLNFTSGRRFARLRWGARLHGGRLERDTANGNVNTLQAELDAFYALSRRVSLIGSIGYESIDDPTIAQQPDGAIWSAGLSLNPDPQTSLTATYGRRYADTNVAVNARHQLTGRTAVRASFGESLQTSQQLVIEDLAFLGVDAEGNLIDTRTGLPFTIGDDAFGLQATTFRRRSGALSISHRRRRDTFVLKASFESRKTETPVVREDIVRGIGLTARRRLSRRTLGNLVVDYRNIDFGDGTGREDNTLTLSANLTYQIFRNTWAEIAYTRTQRKSNLDSADLTENTASIRLSRGF